MTRSGILAAAGAILGVAAVLGLSSCGPERTTNSLLGTTRLHRVPSDFSTIQEALDASVSGDTVLVAAGTYSYEDNMDLSFQGKNLVLRSERGASETVIDCKSEARGIIFSHGESRSAIFDGFTIQNGRDDGGAIECISASPTIRHCRLLDNIGQEYGGAIACSGNAHPLIEDCDLIGNTAPSLFGPAVYLDDAAGVTMERCRIAGNDGVGGAIDTDPNYTGPIVLMDCVITGNSGAGVQSMSTDSLHVENCLVARNGQGGISLGRGPALVKGCTITRNGSTTRGAGIDAGGQLTLQNTILSGNTAPMNADLNAAGSVTLTCCQFNPHGIGTDGGQVDSLGLQVHGDPQFCAPRTCPGAGSEVPDTTSAGDYTLRSDSPCLAQPSLNGRQIGAFGQGCTAP